MAAEDLKPERSVIVRSNVSSAICVGDTITITGELIGFEDVEAYSLQWQCNDGSGWTDVSGATGIEHRYSASDKTVKCSWRLVATVEESHA